MHTEIHYPADSGTRGGHHRPSLTPPPDQDDRWTSRRPTELAQVPDPEYLHAARAPRDSRPEPPALLTVDDVAELLQMSRSWVYEHLIRPGDLPSILLGTARRVRRTDFDRFVEDARLDSTP